MTSQDPKYFKEFIRNFSKADIPQLLCLVPQLVDFMPQLTQYIIPEVLSTFIKFIDPTSTSFNAELNDACLYVIAESIHLYDHENYPSSDSLPLLVKNFDFFEALFKQEIFNKDCLYIFEHIIDSTYVSELKKFVERRPKIVIQILNTIAKNHDIKMGKVIYQILSYVDKPFSGVDNISPIIKSLPPGVAIDFIVAYRDVVTKFSTQEIREWLEEKYDLDITDVDLFVKEYPELEKSDFIIGLLTRVTPYRRIEKTFQFIHSRKPYEFSIGEMCIMNISKSLLKPAFNFVKKKDSIYKAAYYYLNLFLASLISPAKFEPNLVPKVFDLCFHKNKFISCAAIQTLFIWSKFFEFTPNIKIVPLLCSISLSDAKYAKDLPGVSTLCQAFLSTLCEKYEHLFPLFSVENKLQLQDGFSDLVSLENWTFPQIKRGLDQTIPIKPPNITASYAVLSVFLKSFFDGEKQTEEI